MKIIIGCDLKGIEYKDQIIKFLNSKNNIEIIDGGYTDYYAETADIVGNKILNKEADRGILICGGGNGMLIAANKIPGIRATYAFNKTALEKSVTSSACQIIVFGSEIIDINEAFDLIEHWLKFDYPDKLSDQVNKVIELEQKYNK